MDNPIIVALDNMTLDKANELMQRLQRWVAGFKVNDLNPV